MALYDNKHWLLSHIRNSFITSDDSGMCEVVMICDNVAKQTPVDKYDCYSGIEPDEDEDDIDALAHSFDLNSDLHFGLRPRHRSNTAQRLEKLEEEKKKAANALHVKWMTNPIPLSDEEKSALFPKKDIEEIRKKISRVSLLTELLEKFPDMPENPFKDYAKLDGNAQVGVPVKRYLIYVTLFSVEKQKYPLEIVIVASAKVLDLIGLICWKISIDHTDVVLKESASHYSLYIAEDDGDVDWDFPCLDTREVVSKFGFTYLALVERDSASHNHDESYPLVIHTTPEQVAPEAAGSTRTLNDSKLQGKLTSLATPLNVYILNKVRTKTEIYIEITWEKLEISPAVPPPLSTGRVIRGKLFKKQRAESHSMDDVVACDLTENKSNNRSTFRLVHYHYKSDGRGESGKFKTRDFESETSVAADIVQTINHILDLRQSSRRREYIALRERKSHRRKNFHIVPR